MFRKTLTIFSLIGLLLSMGLWVVSYWNVAVGIYRASSVVTVFASRGTVGGEFGPQPNRNPRVDWVVQGFKGLATPAIGRWFSRLHGFTAIQVPLYVPTVLFCASFTYLGLPWYRRRKRRKLGLCLECGYDLRGSKDRCPECGKEFQGSAPPRGSTGRWLLLICCSVVVFAVGLSVRLVVNSGKSSPDNGVGKLPSAEGNQAGELIEMRPYGRLETDLDVPSSSDFDVPESGQQGGQVPILEGSGQQQETEWATHRDDQRHFSLEYPRGWRIATGVRSMMRHHRKIFVALNSAGLSDFWATGEPRVLGDRRSRIEIIAEQLPPGTVYIDVAHGIGGPRRRRFTPHTAESEQITPSAWSSFVQKPPEYVVNGKLLSKELSFWKWTRRWNVVVFLREPVETGALNTVQRVLQSIKFDTYPVGDEGWAVVQAAKHLPSRTLAEQYSFGNHGQHFTRTRKIGEEVLVTFSTRDARDGEHGEMWKFLVTRTGEVIPTLSPE